MSNAMLPTIRLSSVDDNYNTYRPDDSTTPASTVNELWKALTSKNILKLEEILSFRTAPHEKEKSLITISRYQLISAIQELFGTNQYESGASFVFSAAVAAAKEFPTSASASCSSPTTASIFTAFKSSVTSSSSSNESCVASNLSFSQGNEPVTTEDVEETCTWEECLKQFVKIVGEQEEKPAAPERKIFRPHPKFYPLPYMKRECLEKIEKVLPHGSFLIIGRNGTIHALNNRFRPLCRYQISPSTSQLEVGAVGKTSKITDTYVTCSSSLGQEMVVIATATGVLHFIRHSKSSELYEILRITEIPSFVTALHSRVEPDVWWMAIGTNSGSVHLLKSNISFETLLMRADREKTLQWKECFESFGFFENPKAHKSSVVDILYDLESDLLISCSKDSKVGLLVTRPYNNAQKYSFAIFQGVKAMATSWKLHLIATICGDSLVRTWNPFVVNFPLTVLPPSFSHDPPICININEEKALLIVLYIGSVLGVWSVDSCNALQLLRVNIPGGQNWNSLSRPLSHLRYGLLIAGNNHAAVAIFEDRDPSQLVYSTEESEVAFSGDMSFYEEDHREDEEDPEEEDAEEGSGSSPLPLSRGTSVLQSSSSRDTKDDMRRLIRSGAPFCCLTLFSVKKGLNLPKNLPLPNYLNSLDLSTDNPALVLEHIRAPLRQNSLTDTSSSSGSKRT